MISCTSHGCRRAVTKHGPVEGAEENIGGDIRLKEKLNNESFIMFTPRQDCEGRCI